MLTDEDLIDEPDDLLLGDEEKPPKDELDLKKAKRYLDVICKEYELTKEIHDPLARHLSTHIHWGTDGETACGHKITESFATVTHEKLPKDICRTCLYRLGYFGWPAEEQWKTMVGRTVTVSDLLKECSCTNHAGPHWIYSARKVWGENHDKLNEWIQESMARYGITGTVIADLIPQRVERMEQMSLF